MRFRFKHLLRFASILEPKGPKIGQWKCNKTLNFLENSMGALENLLNFKTLSFGRIQKPGGAGVTTQKVILKSCFFFFFFFFFFLKFLDHILRAHQKIFFFSWNKVNFWLNSSSVCAVTPPNMIKLKSQALGIFKLQLRVLKMAPSSYF